MSPRWIRLTRVDVAIGYLSIEVIYVEPQTSLEPKSMAYPEVNNTVATGIVTSHLYAEVHKPSDFIVPADVRTPKEKPEVMDSGVDPLRTSKGTGLGNIGAALVTVLDKGMTSESIAEIRKP